MHKNAIFILIGALLILSVIIANADDQKEAAVRHEISNIQPQKVYPIGYTPKFAAEVACTVRMAGDSYWAISDWCVGNEIYKTYQDPSVAPLNCTYPFEIDAVAMELQFAAPGTVWASVDIEALHPDQSTESCPYPGGVIGISDEYGFYIPSGGVYVAIIPFNEPVVVNEPYFCGFYIAEDITAMDPGIVTDNDPYLCVNWNDWGEGYVDLVDNQYYNFPGNLALYSIGRSGGGSQAVLPHTKIAWPYDSAQVSGNVYIRASELVDTVNYEYCRFEYYHPSSGWTTMTDDNFADISLRNSVSPSSFQEGYSTVWNANSLSEGWYKIRAAIFDSQGGSTADSSNIYLDNTPLKPVFTNPLWGDSICDSVTLRMTIPDEDLSFVQFEYRPASDTITINLPLLNQSRYGDVDGDTLDGNYYSSGEFGDFYNAPTLTGAIIRYFANNGYSDVAKNGGINLTNRQVIEELADIMRIRMNLGSEDDDFLWALRDYFKRRGNQFRIDLFTSLTSENLDYVLGYRKGALIAAIGDPYGHWLGITKIIYPENADNTYTIEIYDTKTGSTIASKLQFNPLPSMLYNGVYRFVDLAAGIYPRTDISSRTPIGLDFNSSDGISFYWDISGIEDGTYYISGTGLDYSSHTGEGIARTYISCIGGVLSGDVNLDGSLNVSDAVYLINYVFTGGPEPKPFLMNGDTNCDYHVNVSDAVYLINYVFTGGPPPCN
jgi:hypothetical protein